MKVYIANNNLYYYDNLIASQDELVEVSDNGDLFTEGGGRLLLEDANQIKKWIDLKMLIDTEEIKDDNVNHPKWYTQHPVV